MTTPPNSLASQLGAVQIEMPALIPSYLVNALINAIEDVQDWGGTRVGEALSALDPIKLWNVPPLPERVAQQPEPPPLTFSPANTGDYQSSPQPEKVAGSEHIVPLAPCPLCAHEAEFRQEEMYWFARCPNCGLLLGQPDGYSSRLDLCNDWNRRPAIAHQPQPASGGMPGVEELNQLSYMTMWYGAVLSSIQRKANDARAAHRVKSHHCELRSAMDSICDLAKTNAKSIAEAGKAYRTLELASLEKWKAKAEAAEAKLTAITANPSGLADYWMRLAKEAINGCEVTEKKLAEVERERAELLIVCGVSSTVEDAKTWMRRNEEIWKERVRDTRAQLASAQSGWVKCSERMPTKEDACPKGFILATSPHATYPQAIPWQNLLNMAGNLWLRIPPLPAESAKDGGQSDIEDGARHEK